MPSQVELLGTGTAHAASPGPRWSAILWLLMGIAFLGAVLVLPGGQQSDALAGQLFEPVAPYLGDPFAREWVSLDGVSSGPSGYERPLPMVSKDPPCVGFGRLDWPVQDRQPTVARCFDSQTADQLPRNGVSVLLRISAGADTWFIFLFGKEVTEVELRAIDLVIAPDRVYLGQRYAAILVPVNSQIAGLAWGTRGGQRYEISDDAHSFISGVEADEL